MMEYFYLCSVTCVTTAVYLRSCRRKKSDENDNTDTKDASDNKESEDEINNKLKSLQLVYLPAHLLALFSDWLQVKQNICW